MIAGDIQPGDVFAGTGGYVVLEVVKPPALKSTTAVMVLVQFALDGGTAWREWGSPGQTVPLIRPQDAVAAHRKRQAVL